MSIKETARLLGIKEATLYLWSEKGEIPSYKFGRLVRFKKEDIEAWAESRKVNMKPLSTVTRGSPGDIKKLIENVKRAVLTSKEGKAGIASLKGG